LPIARSPEGLPIGAQLIGGFLEDRTTIALAGMIERALGCAFTPPPGYYSSQHIVQGGQRDQRTRQYTVEFKLSEPRPVNFMMSAIASGWQSVVHATWVNNVLPFSPEMASAILAKRVDYVFATDPATFRKATTTQGMSTETH
jgi:hypothetical protein